jgi:hypothetical protein
MDRTSRRGSDSSRSLSNYGFVPQPVSQWEGIQGGVCQLETTHGACGHAKDVYDQLVSSPTVDVCIQHWTELAVAIAPNDGLSAELHLLQHHDRELQVLLVHRVDHLLPMTCGRDGLGTRVYLPKIDDRNLITAVDCLRTAVEVGDPDRPWLWLNLAQAMGPRQKVFVRDAWLSKAEVFVRGIDAPSECEWLKTQVWLCLPLSEPIRQNQPAAYRLEQADMLKALRMEQLTSANGDNCDQHELFRLHCELKNIRYSAAAVALTNEVPPSTRGEILREAVTATHFHLQPDSHIGLILAFVFNILRERDEFNRYDPRLPDFTIEPGFLLAYLSFAVACSVDASNCINAPTKLIGYAGAIHALQWISDNTDRIQTHVNSRTRINQLKTWIDFNVTLRYLCPPDPWSAPVFDPDSFVHRGLLHNGTHIYNGLHSVCRPKLPDRFLESCFGAEVEAHRSVEDDHTPAFFGRLRLLPVQDTPSARAALQRAKLLQEKRMINLLFVIAIPAAQRLILVWRCPEVVQPPPFLGGNAADDFASVSDNISEAGSGSNTQARTPFYCHSLYEWSRIALAFEEEKSRRAKVAQNLFHLAFAEEILVRMVLVLEYLRYRCDRPMHVVHPSRIVVAVSDTAGSGPRTKRVFLDPLGLTAAFEDRTCGGYGWDAELALPEAVSLEWMQGCRERMCAPRGLGGLANLVQCSVSYSVFNDITSPAWLAPELRCPNSDCAKSRGDSYSLAMTLLDFHATVDSVCRLRDPLGPLANNSSADLVMTGYIYDPANHGLTSGLRTAFFTHFETLAEMTAEEVSDRRSFDLILVDNVKDLKRHLDDRASAPSLTPNRGNASDGSFAFIGSFAKRITDLFRPRNSGGDERNRHLEARLGTLPTLMEDPTGRTRASSGALSDDAIAASSYMLENFLKPMPSATECPPREGVAILATAISEVLELLELNNYDALATIPRTAFYNQLRKRFDSCKDAADKQAWLDRWLELLLTRRARYSDATPSITNQMCRVFLAVCNSWRVPKQSDLTGLCWAASIAISLSYASLFTSEPHRVTHVNCMNRVFGHLETWAKSARDAEAFRQYFIEPRHQKESKSHRDMQYAVRLLRMLWDKLATPQQGQSPSPVTVELPFVNEASREFFGSDVGFIPGPQSKTEPGAADSEAAWELLMNGQLPPEADAVADPQRATRVFIVGLQREGGIGDGHASVGIVPPRDVIPEGHIVLIESTVGVTVRMDSRPAQVIDRNTFIRLKGEACLVFLKRTNE